MTHHGGYEDHIFKEFCCGIFASILSLCPFFLQAGSPRTQRSPKTQRMAESSARDIFGNSPPAPTNMEPSLSSNPSSLSGVDGDIKEAFGDRSAGRNLRDDLLLAADSVTSAMSSLVKELNSGKIVCGSWPDIFGGVAKWLKLLFRFCSKVWKARAGVQDAQRSLFCQLNMEICCRRCGHFVSSLTFSI